MKVEFNKVCSLKNSTFISYYQKMAQADMNEQKKYFKCFELFYKTWKNLPTEIKAKYYDALMEYGLYWTEPTDPVILSLMQWAMYSIDKFEAHRKKTSKSMEWNSNAVDKREKHTKQIKTDTNRWEQMLSDGSIEDKEEKENIKRKYLECVYLTDREYNQAVEWYGERVVKDYIERVNDWILEKPKSKDRQDRDHYKTILNRIRRAWINKKTKKKENESWIYDLPF